MTFLNPRVIGAGILIAGVLVAGQLADSNPPGAHANDVEGTALSDHWGGKIIQSLGMPLGPSGLVLTGQTSVVIDGPQPDSVTAQAMTLSGSDHVDLTPAGSANEFTLHIERPGKWAYLRVVAQYRGDAYVEWVWTVGARG